MYGASVSEGFYWVFALFNTAPHRNIRVARNCFLFVSSKGCMVAEICFRGVFLETSYEVLYKECLQGFRKFRCHADKQTKVPTHPGRHVHQQLGSLFGVIGAADNPELTSHTRDECKTAVKSSAVSAGVDLSLRLVRASLIKEGSLCASIRRRINLSA